MFHKTHNGYQSRGSIKLYNNMFYEMQIFWYNICTLRASPVLVGTELAKFAYVCSGVLRNRTTGEGSKSWKKQRW
jgi:hypothetical protein